MVEFNDKKWLLKELENLRRQCEVRGKMSNMMDYKGRIEIIDEVIERLK